MRVELFAASAKSTQYAAARAATRAHPRFRRETCAFGRTGRKPAQLGRDATARQPKHVQCSAVRPICVDHLGENLPNLADGHPLPEKPSVGGRGPTNVNHRDSPPPPPSAGIA
jgi:hypothetical protein